MKRWTNYYDSQSAFVHKRNNMKTKIRNKYLPQLIATLGGSMLLLEIGMEDGWMTPNMDRLTQANSTIPLTLYEASWLASYYKLGRSMSVIPMPILIDLVGSKRAIFCTFFPVIVSWILIIMAKSATCLYIARFLTGVTASLTFASFPVYFGEISTPRFRGTFISMVWLGYSLGSVVAIAAETHLPEVVSCTVYLMPCLLGISLFAWLPESPYHLLKRKNSVKARQSLEWYRGQYDTETEMKDIVEYIESTNTETIVEKVKQLRLAPIQKAAFLVTLIYMCPQVCGVFNVVFFMQIILTNAKFHLIKPSNAVLCLNIILFVSATFSVNLNDRFGRRKLLMVSMTAMLIGHASLGFHYYLLNKVDVNPESIQALPLVAIILLIVPFWIAFSPAASCLLGEMFSASIKSTAATIVIFVSTFVGFITTVAYEPLISAIGEIYVFWMYAALVTLFLPIVVFFLPETKGKSLQEIQNILNKK